VAVRLEWGAKSRETKKAGEEWNRVLRGAERDGEDGNMRNSKLTAGGGVVCAENGKVSRQRRTAEENGTEGFEMLLIVAEGKENMQNQKEKTTKW
jgi:hypothetical protein